MNIKSLNGEWKLYYFNQLEYNPESPSGLGKICEPIGCTVPGNVELDLSRQGVLPEDLYYGMNMKQCEKYETCQWWYEKEFELTDEELVSDMYLCFEGVDTIAEYFLNGVRIGESRNMLIPHEFCINGAMQKKNVLYHIFPNHSVLKMMLPTLYTRFVHQTYSTAPPSKLLKNFYY